MNSVCIIGRLGADPEVRYAQSGTAFCKLRVCHTERRKKGEEWVDHPVWIGVQLFEKAAENAGQYLHKGDEVGVEGRLSVEEWTDKTSNEKRSAHVVLANRIDFLRKKGEANSGSAEARANERGKPKAGGKADSEEAGFSDGDGAAGNTAPIEDDLPF